MSLITLVSCPKGCIQGNMHQGFLNHNKNRVTFNIGILPKRKYAGKYASMIFKSQKKLMSLSTLASYPKGYMQENMNF